jgi:hypothetical protein
MIDFLKTLYASAKMASYYRQIAEQTPGPHMRDALIRGLDTTGVEAKGLASDQKHYDLAA